MSLRVLLIDDDNKLRALLGEYMAPHDVQVVGSASGAEGIAALAEQVFDAVFLDVMMPGLDGLSVLRKIRQHSQVPVIMLTARGDEADRVVGLELGADDYVAKPFSPRELLARLRAVLRRVGPDLMDEQLRVAGIEVSVSARTVRRDDKHVELTGIEFDLLVALMRRAGRVVPRESLLAYAGREGVTVGERTVDVHVSKLRKKLGQPSVIETVRGVGYVLAKGAAS